MRARLAPATTAMLLAGVLCGCAVDFPAPGAASAADSRRETARSAPSRQGVTERYAATLAGLPAGDAVLQMIPGPRPGALVLRLDFATAAWLAPLCPVEESITVLCDATRRRPERSLLVARVSGEERRMSLRFDDEARAVQFEQRGDGGQVDRVLDLPEAVEPLTLLLLARGLPLEAGLRRTFNAVIGARCRSVRIEVLGIEPIQVAGEDPVPSWRLEVHLLPVDATEGETAPADRIDAWIGMDPPRPLLRLDLPTPIGSLRIERLDSRTSRPETLGSLDASDSE